MTTNEKKRLLITGLAAQQVYAHCHDEAVGLGVFRQDLKMASKTLVAKLERELKPVFKTLGDVQDGDVYIGVLQVMENVFIDLAELPLEYWHMVGIYIREIKELANEANEERANSTNNGGVQGELDNERGDDKTGSDTERVEGQENDK